VKPKKTSPDEFFDLPGEAISFLPLADVMGIRYEGMCIAQFEKARRVRQTSFLQRPARAQIAHLALGKLWNPFESGDPDHECSFAIFVA
jgi:hypothetical protein